MKEKDAQQEETGKRNNAWSCCRPEEWMNCCGDGADGAEGMRGRGVRMAGPMRKCFSMCRYFPLVPVIMGAGFLALGYFLSAESIRLLWMVGAGILVTMGLFGLVIAGRMASRIGSIRP